MSCPKDARSQDRAETLEFAKFEVGSASAVLLLGAAACCEDLGAVAEQRDCRPICALHAEDRFGSVRTPITSAGE